MDITNPSYDLDLGVLLYVFMHVNIKSLIQKP